MATLEDVDYKKGAEIDPFIKSGIYSQPIEGLDRIVLDSKKATAFVNYIIEVNQRPVIEETLQSLCQRNDGTLLKTAFPSFQEFAHAINGLDQEQFDFLFEALDFWQQHGCNEVCISFEEHEKR